MALKTLQEQYYATNDTIVNPAFWNGFIGDVAVRFRELETIKISWEEVSQQGLGVALDRINEVLGPAAERISRIAELGFLTVPASVTRTLAADTVISFVMDEGDQRDLFTPSPFVAITRENDAFDFGVGRVVYFDRVSGVIDIDVDYVSGDPGPHSDWIIAAVAGQVLAQSQILDDTKVEREAAELAKTAAQNSSNSAASSAAAATTAKNEAQAARADVFDIIAPPGPTPPADPVDGMVWYDGSILRVYDGSTFAPAITASIGGLRFESGTFGPSPSGVITVGGGFTSVMVFINGALKKLATDYTLASPNITVLSPVEGQAWFVWAVKALDAVDYYTKEEANALFATAVAVTASLAAKIDLNPDVGEVKYFARNTAPTGYLKANGAAVSRVTYSRLFEVIGTSFGAGNGSSTFNVPNLRGEFIRGWDDGRGIDTGRVFGSAQTDAFKSHSHTVGKGQTGGGAFVQNGPSEGGDITTSLTGGSETRPRNIALLACIRY
jgi:hypothetical protein